MYISFTWETKHDIFKWGRMVRKEEEEKNHTKNETICTVNQFI